MNRAFRYILPFILFILTTLLISDTRAQSSGQDVLLHFRHQGVVNTYISAVYEQDRFYLSAEELFTALGLDLTTDAGSFSMHGHYLGREEFTFDLASQTASLDDHVIELSADDFLITELGFYLDPELFYSLFEMEFTIDFGNLSISLITPDTMPVVAQRDRERRREYTLQTRRELSREFHPLEFDRQQHLFNGGFLDYNLSFNHNARGQNFVYNTSIGTELLGGDLEGTVFGNYSESASVLRTAGLRWRYGIHDNNLISTVTAGQTVSDGLLPVSYSGIQLSNEPLEPRFMYGETTHTGTAEPGSEVELYRNNMLIDYSRSDESGQYRFSIPITYGTTSYSIRSYLPGGGIQEQNLKLQVPFQFVPAGEINYTLDMGRLDNPLSGSIERGLVSKGTIRAGLSNRITATGGVEYYQDFHDELPTLSTGISARLFTNYLVSAEIASHAFYRVGAGVTYPNNSSINLEYTRYNTLGGVYNPGRNRSSFRGSVFTPFDVGSLPLFLRGSVTHEQRTFSDITRYRFDLNSRVGRTNLRVGFRDSQVGRVSFGSTPVARLYTSATYNLPRSRDLPRLLRGVFLRGQTHFLPSQNRLEDAELQISRNVFRNGRFQVSAGRNFTGDFNLFRFSLTYDFSRVRTGTSLRRTRNTTTMTQSARGSAGYDSSNRQPLLTNRQQTGRAGLAVRMFVDNNNSGTYDEGDQLLPEGTIRIDRAGGNYFTRDGIQYVSLLQPYRQYNLTVNTSSVQNPLLVPALEEFSIITDPNQYKLIEIPFHMSGVIDGQVLRHDSNQSRGVSGLRLQLIRTDEDQPSYTKEIRTFSDGSFYAYEIPPGDYILKPDSSQLTFMNMKAEPEQLEFTIRALSEGDFIESLELNLYPLNDDTLNTD